MDFYLYFILSLIYIMVIHFAVGIKKEFNLFLMISGFVIGGIVGWQMKSWETGMVVGVVLSLMFY